MESIVLAGGCFWCVEAVFQRVDGVFSAISGYTGGHSDNPSYEEVCTGRTGHAEAVKVTWDSSRTNLDTLLGVFWHCHDPTQLNRQGNDVGSQYRSAIFHSDEAQESISRSSLEAVRAVWAPRRIVTQIEVLRKFWPAEDYHQNYFNRNPENAYCRAVIPPKLKKLSLT